MVRGGNSSGAHAAARTMRSGSSVKGNFAGISVAETVATIGVFTSDSAGMSICALAVDAMNASRNASAILMAHPFDGSAFSSSSSRSMSTIFSSL